MNETAGAAINNYADSEELKKFCIIMGIAHSNALYRILSAKDDGEMLERIKDETSGITKSSRGADKCNVGQIWDAAKGVCVDV